MYVLSSIMCVIGKLVQILFSIKKKFREKRNNNSIELVFDWSQSYKSSEVMLVNIETKQPVRYSVICLMLTAHSNAQKLNQMRRIINSSVKRKSINTN